VAEGWRIALGLLAGFAALQGSASALGSVRGEWGIVVGAIVVASLLAIECLLHGRSLCAAGLQLGLGRPVSRGLVAAFGLGLAMLAVIPIHFAITGARWAMYEGWLLLVPGLFAQGGIAEEALFRGYLFRRLRARRSFARAALVATPPFIAVHLLMFVNQPWMIALASVILAAIISIPLAWLFELGGNTIWAPAILHFVVQGALKVILVEGEAAETLPLVWIAAAAVIPFAVFAVPRVVEPTHAGDPAV
jgi:membrane protease YdiL (CAAX protease family)